MTMGRNYSLPTLLAVILMGVFLLPAISHSESPISFTKNLSLGQSGAEVKNLQIALNLDPETAVATIGNGSSGHETIYFGTATRNAVIRFQNKYADEVLSPAGLTRGTGYVGALTRKKLNSTLAPQILYPETSTSTDSFFLGTPSPEITNKIPVIERIEPDHGAYGSEFTIYGKNFSATNTVHTTYLPFYNVAAVSSTEIKFTFINPQFTLLQQLKDRGKKVDDLNLAFYLFVENEYGKSREKIRYTAEIRKH